MNRAIQKDLDTMNRLITDCKIISFDHKREYGSNESIEHIFLIKVLDKDGDQGDGGVLWVKIANTESAQLEEIQELISLYPGCHPVMIYAERDGLVTKLNDNLCVDLDNNKFLNELKTLVGEKCVLIKGR